MEEILNKLSQIQCECKKLDELIAELDAEIPKWKGNIKIIE